MKPQTRRFLFIYSNLFINLILQNRGESCKSKLKKDNLNLSVYEIATYLYSKLGSFLIQNITSLLLILLTKDTFPLIFPDFSKNFLFFNTLFKNLKQHAFTSV